MPDFQNHTTTRRRTWVLLLTCLVSLLAYKAAAQSYSLEEAVQYAQENNKQVINDQLSSTAAMCKVGEARGALLPRLDLQNQYLYYMTVPEQYAPASNFGGPEGEYAKMSFNLQQNVSSSLQLSQPIINKEAHLRVEAAQISYQASIAQIAVTKESLTYNVSATYYTIQVLKDNLVRLADNIANLEQTVEINEVLKDNQLIASNVHQRLLINLQNLRNEYQNQQLNLEKNLLQLKYLMNLHATDTIDVLPFAYEEEMGWTIGAEIAHRPDLRLQKIQITLAETELKSVTARYMPVVSGTLSTGFTGYYDEFAPNKQINGDWINNSYVAITAKFPLFAGFQKRFQAGQQKLNIQRNVNTMTLMQLRAEKEVLDARENYRTNKNQLANTKESLDLAEQLFSSAQGDYANGISTISDLLNAQSDLTDARSNYSNAMLNLKLSELALKKAYGAL